MSQGSSLSCPAGSSQLDEGGTEVVHHLFSPRGIFVNKPLELFLAAKGGNLEQMLPRLHGFDCFRVLDLYIGYNADLLTWALVDLKS